jgi:DNA repair photolyase
MTQPLPILHGRGTALNPANRFEAIHVEPEYEYLEHDPDAVEKLARPPTRYYLDRSRSIIAQNDSPDVGFSHSINPYRGCSHGCSYCFARPGHAYLAMSAGLDFEMKIMVKPDAAMLLRRELSRESWRPTTLQVSGVTDCYQPGERHFRLTRQCLEVLAEFRNPASLITKNHLITRDLDLLGAMANWHGVAAIVSITTLDANLARVMEPRTSTPARRLEAVRKLADAGVPVGVMVAPIIPGLNDHEPPQILAEAAKAGATFCGYVVLRLPWEVAPIFEDWLGQHLPDRADKVLNRVRELRGGKLNSVSFGDRMRGRGVWAEQIRAVFAMAKRRAGIAGTFPALSTAQFRRPGGQMNLF